MISSLLKGLFLLPSLSCCLLSGVPSRSQGIRNEIESVNTTDNVFNESCVKYGEFEVNTNFSSYSKGQYMYQFIGGLTKNSNDNLSMDTANFAQLAFDNVDLYGVNLFIYEGHIQEGQKVFDYLGFRFTCEDNDDYNLIKNIQFSFHDSSFDNLYIFRNWCDVQFDGNYTASINNTLGYVPTSRGLPRPADTWFSINDSGVSTNPTWQVNGRNIEEGYGDRFTEYGFIALIGAHTAQQPNLQYDFVLHVDLFGEISYGYTQGFNVGYNDGVREGYLEGYQDGLDISDNANFNSLMAAIADTPIRMLFSLFNFDLFGTNLLVAILSLLTGIVLFGIFKKFIL